jgi:hypothetical protein
VNGLISAAQSAAFRISSLVQIANRVIQKSQSWEYIIAGSEEVQMAAVQLVTAARAKLDNQSINNRNLSTAQQEVSAAVKTLVATANAFHEEVEPLVVHTEELSSNKAHAAVYQHKSDVEALEVALKREQMQLLELLTQASGGRTEDLSMRSNTTAEVVNRGEDVSLSTNALSNPFAGALSPRKATNPFAVPSAATFEPHKASAVKPVPLFGGAVVASKTPSAAASGAPTVWKQPPPAEPVRAAPSPVGVVPSAALFEPMASVAIPMIKKTVPKAEEIPSAKASPSSAPPAKFNPFAAVGTGSPMVKRGPVPPPPGQGAPTSTTRPVPPPPSK